MNVTEKINYLKGIKEDIRQAIEDKGVDVPTNTPLKDYADCIGEIQGGGGEGMSAKDCTDLNLYLAGDWYGDIVSSKSLEDSHDIYGMYSNRNMTSYTNTKTPVTPPYFLYGCTRLKSLSLTSNLSQIAINDYTCCRCTSLETVDVPNTARIIIQPYAFSSCTSLKSISVNPNSSNNSIVNYAFYDCTSLEEVNIPNITIIGTMAFSCQTPGSLTKIDLSKVTSIGTSFRNQNRITEVTAPKMTSLTTPAFSYMGGLKKATLSGITGNFGTTANSGNNPFAYSPNIEVVDVGTSVLSIRYLTYYTTDPSTGWIKNLIIRKTTAPTLYNYACMDPVTNIYVPDESVDTYKHASNWSNSAVVIKIKPISEYVEE